MFQNHIFVECINLSQASPFPCFCEIYAFLLNFEEFAIVL